jgi:tetratricopeptide (TPR) repeat protein
MKLLKHYIVFCLLLLGMPMVAQQWYFTIDEYRDAEHTALRDVRRVLVVNNALVQPTDFGHSTVLDGKNQGGIEVALDRAPLYNMFSLTQLLDGSGEMDLVELLDKSQNSSTNYYQRMVLSQQRANELLQRYNVDALLVLNQLVLYDVVEAFLTEEGGYYAYMQAFAQSHWNVYYADRRPVRTITQADTLVWESDIEYTRTQALNRLPNRQEALLYLASEVGTKLGQSLVPSWEPVRRYLYDDDHAYVQQGLEAFRYQRWQEAILYWQSVANTEGGKSSNSSNRSKRGKDNKAAAVATANMAIAYELLGDYDSACASANEACRLFGALKSAWARQQQVNIRYYQEQLRAKKAKEDAR